MDKGGTGVETEPRSPARLVDARVGPARLLVVYPTELRAAIPLCEGHTVLGREGDGNVVRLGHGTVSRRHLSIDWDARTGTHLCRDLGSRNGTTVDRRSVAEPLGLRDGSVVRAGDVILLYELGAGEDGPSEVSREAVPGEAAVMGRLRARIGRAATDPAPVLLYGETGTGKERIAGEIHRLSGRRGPYVPVNCAALSRELCESQLFGHVRGAFTGAKEAQPGLFRSAEGGTLFLDEIGELPPDLQPKLLRALQEGEVLPVGTSRAVRVDVRVLAATHRDLAAAAEQGSFRRDLYARLSLWELSVPPLRRRRVDLLDWFARLGGTLIFEPDAAERLLLSDWPTNLRGLERLLRELRDHKGPIAAAELPSWITARPGAQGAPLPSGATARPPPPSQEDFVQAFRRLDGSVHALSRHFHRDRRQIYRWLHLYGLRERG